MLNEQRYQKKKCREMLDAKRLAVARDIHP